MLGAADIDAWDEDVRDDAHDELRRAGFDRVGDAPTRRLRRLLARWRTGEPLSTRELAELRNALVPR